MNMHMHGVQDAYGFAFSFTAQDGTLKYCCAVCGADPSQRDSSQPVTLVLMCCSPAGGTSAGAGVRTAPRGPAWPV